MEAMLATPRREPWNKGKLVGQKAPLKPKDIWAIRVRLQMHERLRELALLNLGIDSISFNADALLKGISNINRAEKRSGVYIL